MMNEQKIPAIPAEKFQFVQQDRTIHDERIKTKPIGYFKDAWLRFVRNKSAVVAFVLILILVLFAIIVPFISRYDVNFRSGYYKSILPRNEWFVGTGFWDGGHRENVNEDSYQAIRAIGKETGRSAILKEYSTYQDANNLTYHNIRTDSYAKVGFAYINLSEAEYQKLMAYQDERGIQVIYPLAKTSNVDYLQGNAGANYWYKLRNEASTSNGAPLLDENEEPIPNYQTSDNPNRANYNSLRVSWDNGGEDGNSWLVYAQKNQSGYRVRVDYYEYFRYTYGQAPSFLFGTNVFGQDLLTCLAAGARLSFLLAICISAINFLIGGIYGAIEGYYGGAADLVMERISDVLYDVPFIVVATLFQLHLAQKVGVLGSLLFAFVLTGWVGIAARVRMQFYRFKGHEYVLAARTLGANDRRLIFKHIYPNSLGTIITGSVLAIPGVIFTESTLSYLRIINLETSSLTSIGTLLAGGEGYLSTYPHIIFFPALFISILEISFNLFGNGLRDALNPSLRGAED